MIKREVMVAAGLVSIILLLVILLPIYCTLGKKPSVRQRQRLELELEVETSLGRFRGIASASRDGREFYEWLGIPYAKPPVGSLRFASPQPIEEKWEGVLNVSEYGSPCGQVDVVTRQIKGQEDCLFLNIHTPKISNAEKLLPILFFIHGGSFICGSADEYKPHYFMDEDVILVTINYRLGPLGFLSTGDAVVRGNMGLKDQSMALQWVHDNIANFGGDPKQITIFGESAGSASIHYHLLSNKSHGLMRRAISQSGSALNFWAIKDAPVGQAKNFAKGLNCTAADFNEILECLRKINFTEMLEIQREYFTFTRERDAIFSPTVEAVVDDDTFLTDLPMNLITSGRIAKIPWLAGFNADEGLLFMLSVVKAPDYLERVENNWDVMVDTLLYLSDVEKQENNSAKIRQFYFGPRTRDQKLNLVNEFSTASNLLADRNFNYGMYKAAIAHAQHAPVQFYFYNKTGPSPFGTIYFDEHIRGVCHGDELAMLFETFGILRIWKGEEYYEFSRDLVKSWVEFASIPNSDHTTFRGQQFPRVDPNSNGNMFDVIEINDEPQVRKFPAEERMDFWKSIDHEKRRF